MAPAAKVHAIKTVAAGKIRPTKGNPRVHPEQQLALLQGLIQEFGFTVPLIIDEKQRLIAGHGRLAAGQALGMTEFPCVEVRGLSEPQRRALALADNKVPLAASWDMDLLRAEFLALGATDIDLAVTGFSPDEIAQAMTWAERQAGLRMDPDAAPAAEAVAISRPGDLWLCGKSRVLCGDATELEDVRRAVGRGLAHCVWTDPPYNVAYEGAAGSIANDAMDGAAFATFLTAAFRALGACVSQGGAIYVAHADTEGLTFRAAFRAAGLKLSGCLIWRKDALVLGRSDYQWQHEPILYGWRPGAKHRWYGGRKQTTLAELGPDSCVQLPDGRWQLRIEDRILVVAADAKVEEVASTVLTHERPKASAEHPTMKPVGLIERMLKNSAKAGDLVLDPFAGSGSTLIACVQLGMRAALVELEPRFVDVIVRRRQEFTGQQALLEGSNATWEAVRAERG